MVSNHGDSNCSELFETVSRDRRGVGFLLGNLDAGTWYTCTIPHIPKVPEHVVFLGFSTRLDICCNCRVLELIMMLYKWI